MAKTCKVCKKPYPEELTTCPHCAESLDFARTGKEGQEESSPVVRLRNTPAAPGEEPLKISDSDINLAEALSALDDKSKGPDSEAQSGDWASMVEEVKKKPADEAPSKAKFDSPSDRELLEKASKPSKPAPPTKPPVPPPPATDSDQEIVIFDDGSNIGAIPGVVEASDSGTVIADLGPPSDASSVNWDSLVDESSKQTKDKSGELRVDAPSDIDLLQQLSPHGKTPSKKDSGSSVDIDTLPESSGPPSGASVVRWDSLVDESQGGSGSSSDVKIDSPSDASLLRHAASDSGTSKKKKEPPLIEELDDDEIGDLGLPPMPTHTGEIDVTEEVFDDDSSDVNLGTDSDHDDDDKVDKVGDSGIGLGRMPSSPHGALDDLPLESVEVGPEGDMSPFGPTSDSGSNPDIFTPEEDGSTVGLGDLPPPKKPASGRDLIAEAVESGVDLDKIGEDVKGPPAGESSSVDLGAASRGSSSQVNAPPSSGAMAAELLGEASSGSFPKRHASDLDLEADGPRSSSVNLGEMAEVGEASSSSIRGRAAEADLLDEEVAAGEEEEPVTPAKGRAGAKPPKPKYGRRWVGGGVLGALVGAGACVALWFGGIEPPAEWRGETKPTNPGTRPPVVSAQPPADLVRIGDFDKALAGLPGTGENTPTHKALRGEALWLKHLREQGAKGEKPKADSAEVTEAIAVLTEADKAGNADAAFWLAHIAEMTGKVDDARKKYAEGAKRFEKEPAQARRFQTALDRLDVSLEKAADARLRDHLQAMVLLLVMLQPPDAVGGAAEPDEAGYEFWSAVKMAQQGKYADAIKALDKARALHDKQRFNRLRKPQNPQSDPTEEIFLKTCEELKTYWLIRDQLQQKGYLDIAKKIDPAKAVESLPPMAELAAMKADVEKLKDAKVAIEKAEKEAADFKGLVKKTEDKLKETQETAAKATKKLEDELKTAAEQVKTTEAKLKAVGSRLEAAGIKQADPTKAVDELAAARKTAEAALDDVTRKLKDAKFLAADAKPGDVAKGLNTALEVANAKDPGGQLKTTLAEMKKVQDQLNQRRSPEEVLALWGFLLQDRSHTEPAKDAVVDVGRVINAPGVTPDLKAKAQYVQGLALRNQGKIVEARAALAQAVKDGGAGEWQKQARLALQELTDPTVYYLPRAEQLHQAREDKEALKELDQALLLFPKDNGRLLALRSLVKLELARAEVKGQLTANHPGAKDAGQDAQDAIRAGAATHGHYAEGRLAEELGNLLDARRNYQQALAGAEPDDPMGHRIRLAMARVLLKMNQPPAAAGAGGDRVGRAPATPEERGLDALMSLLILAAQPGEPSNIEEAQKLADAVLAGKDGPDSFLLKSQALAIKGLWTKALMMYVDGLRPQLRRDYGDTLNDLVKNHPALKRPDSLVIANPLAAEQHFATGLRNYNSREYAAAEKEFLAAVESDNQDARYYYFLGLSRLPLNKRDEAFEDFEQGSRLEKQNRPSRNAVSAALERVQGPQRQTVNRFRQ